MRSIDVFNGDADGICALHQLRLHTPRPGAQLVTGVKRDIRLLRRVEEVVGCQLTVLDISLDANRAEMERLLASGNTVQYADHHYSGELPISGALTAYIDPSPHTCTSLIVDRLLAGRFRPWALVGAYGDNLDETATALAEASGLRAGDAGILRELGQLLNYNGYGSTEADLHVPPADLYRELCRFADPLEFAGQSALLAGLREGHDRDMARTEELTPRWSFTAGHVYLLPAARWARRVVGVFANRIARQEPDLAHATLIPNTDGSLLVSVRAPRNNPQGADSLCRQFPTGGGRSAAAGINQLPPELLDSLLATFAAHFTA